MNAHLNLIRSLKTIIEKSLKHQKVHYFLHSIVLSLTHDKKQLFVLFLITEVWLNLARRTSIFGED